MRSEVTTNAIVVKTMDYKEADRLYTIFTAEAGMVTALGTSVRKPRSKLAGHLAVPGVVRVFFVKGRQFERLAGAQLIEPFAELSASAAGMQSYGILRQLLAIAHPEPAQDLAVFDAFVSVCRILQQPAILNHSGQRNLWVHLFALRLLAHSGYHPVVDACVRCGDRQNSLTAFSVEAGGFMCGPCHRVVPSAQPLSPWVVSLFQRVLLHQTQTEQRFALPSQEVDGFVHLVRALLHYYFSPAHPISFQDILTAGART